MSPCVESVTKTRRLSGPPKARVGGRGALRARAAPAPARRGMHDPHIVQARIRDQQPALLVHCQAVGAASVRRRRTARPGHAAVLEQGIAPHAVAARDREEQRRLSSGEKADAVGIPRHVGKQQIQKRSKAGAGTAGFVDRAVLSVSWSVKRLPARSKIRSFTPRSVRCCVAPGTASPRPSRSAVARARSCSR